MSTIGLMGLLVAFAGVAISVLCLLAGAILGRKQESSLLRKTLVGRPCCFHLTTIALTVFLRHSGVLLLCRRLFHRVRAEAAQQR